MAKGKDIVSDNAGSFAGSAQDDEQIFLIANTPLFILSLRPKDSDGFTETAMLFRRVAAVFSM